MEIEIRGLPELYQKLGRLATLDYLVDPMQAGLYRLELGMKKYPSARSSSAYRRTGALGQHWVAEPVKRIPEGLQGTIGNNIRYGPWVQSSAFQAYMHRGIWQTDQQVMDNERGFIIGLFEAAVARAV